MPDFANEPIGPVCTALLTLSNQAFDDPRVRQVSRSE
jgi:hypothetical protein